MTIRSSASRAAWRSRRTRSAQSALDVLREGGNALEAMIACAATIPVAYPHMNSIGGDRLARALAARRAARHRRLRCARARLHEWYAARGITKAIPSAAASPPHGRGTISGWDAAFRLSRGVGRAAAIEAPLADAINTRNGASWSPQPVIRDRRQAWRARDPVRFREAFLPAARFRRREGFKQPRLAQRSALARAGSRISIRAGWLKAIAHDLAR